MPRIVSPTPPPPVNATTATKVYGSELLIALIRHFRGHPGTTQKSAIEALEVPQQLVSHNMLILVRAGVIVEVSKARGRKPGTYAIDDPRERELYRALREYLDNK